MERYGIPASITMAQGILESDCGNSRLSIMSNNHFGIKCKRNWTGEKVYHDDDAKGECFRSYPTVEASYQDHAEFLDTQPRYDSLFAYSPTDYKKLGAGTEGRRLRHGARLCAAALPHHRGGPALPAGPARRRAALRFAFGPQDHRSRRLVHRPDQHGAPGRRIVGRRSDNYRVTINAHNGYNVYATNGVHYVLAKEGDTFENIGKKFRISARNLRKFNDLKDKKAQPMPHEVVYIERKKKRWEGNAHTHTCRQGETAYAVGQSYAIRTRSIEKLNKLRPGDTLEQGRQIRIK